jgi:hypothetical protein
MCINGDGEIDFFSIHHCENILQYMESDKLWITLKDEASNSINYNVNDAYVFAVMRIDKNQNSIYAWICPEQFHAVMNCTMLGNGKKYHNYLNFIPNSDWYNWH